MFETLNEQSSAVNLQLVLRAFPQILSGELSIQALRWRSTGVLVAPCGASSRASLIRICSDPGGRHCLSASPLWKYGVTYPPPCQGGL